jgi:DNA polymerase-3 subunit epsilon
MLDWLKNINKEHPEFWKNYVSKFDKKSTRFVVLSTETGMNVEKDVILSIGSFAIDNSIVIGDSFEAVLLQYKFLHDNGLSNFGRK